MLKRTTVINKINELLYYQTPNNLRSCNQRRLISAYIKGYLSALDDTNNIEGYHHCMILEKLSAFVEYNKRGYGESYFKGYYNIGRA